MRTNHDTTGSCIGIITNSYASCYIFRIIRDLYSSPIITIMIFGLPQGKCRFLFAGHILNRSIFTNGNAAALAGIIINDSATAYDYIAGCTASSIRIFNLSPFANSYIFRFWCLATISNGNAIACSSGIVRSHNRRISHPTKSQQAGNDSSCSRLT